MYLYVLIYMSYVLVHVVDIYVLMCHLQSFTFSCLLLFLPYQKKNPLFKIPASVAAKIERLQRDFLWLGKVKEIILLVGM